MYFTKLFALGGAGAVALALVATGAAAGSTPSVSVRVEGRTKTLLPAKLVHTHSGWITKGGAPKGQCPATSAQGALDVATRHHWSGKWSTSFDEYQIFKILGERDSGTPYYWEIFDNNVAATTGACQIKLRSGDRLLFAAVPYPGAVEYPSAVSAPSTAKAHRAFTVKVVYFNAKGVRKPLARAHVAGSTTNSHGIARITAAKAGMLTLTATKTGYIRSEARVRVS